MNRYLITYLVCFHLGQYGVGCNSNVDQTAAVDADGLWVDRMTAVRLRPPGR